jgi:hypothetical protein
MLRSIAVCVAAIALALVSLAAAPPDEAKLLSHAGSFDDLGCLHYRATAMLEAPIAKVFDALSHPERVVNYYISLRLLRVTEPKDGKSKVLEWDGTPGEAIHRPKGPITDPSEWVAGYHVTSREKLVLDPQNFEITRQSLKDPFHSELVQHYKMKKRGRGTVISYTETACSSKIQGAQQDTPEQATSRFMSVLDFVKTDIAHSDAAKSLSGTP